jgi:hypothetical protein
VSAPSIKKLVAAVRDLDTRVALELQWDTDEDDDMRVSWVLALHVIVGRPGKHHSAYSTVELARMPAETVEERRAAHALAAAVAQETGLAVHAASVESQGGQGGSAWIRAQPPGPPHPYEIGWETEWWTDEGEPAKAAAVEAVPSTSGYDAGIVLSRSLLQRFPSRPLSMFIRDGSPRTIHKEGWPAGLPEREAVRAAARDSDCRASAVARAVLAHAPTATNLTLMLAFHESFSIPLEALAALVRWRKGELDDARLDAALPQIERRRLDWDRPRRLREVRASGQSVAAFIRGQRGLGSIQAMKDLMEAFSLSLRVAKEFVDTCRSPDRDAELDARLPVPESPP